MPRACPDRSGLGFELGGTREVLRGLRGLILLAQCEAHAPVCAGGVRIEPERFAEVLCGHVELSCCDVGESELELSGGGVLDGGRFGSDQVGRVARVAGRQKHACERGLDVRVVGSKLASKSQMAEGVVEVAPAVRARGPVEDGRGRSRG